MPDSEYPVLFIISLALGSLIGTKLDIDGAFNRLTGKSGNQNLGQGLSTAILLFCIGTLSILGPIESAVSGNNTFLFTNGTLDLVTSMGLSFYLRNRHRPVGRRAFSVAGRYLSGSSVSAEFYVGCYDDRNFSCGRLSDSLLRAFDSPSESI